MKQDSHAPDTLPPAVRRQDDGSIDFGFYRAEALVLRRAAIRDAITHPGMRRVLVAAGGAVAGIAAAAIAVDAVSSVIWPDSFAGVVFTRKF